MAVTRILMIEDEDEEAASLTAFLQRYAQERSLELQLTHETNAFDLSELAYKCDLILLDIQLPGITGMEAAEILRNQGIETPLIFVTNLAQYAIRGYRVDALDFVVKPVDYTSLAMALDKALRVLDRVSGPNIVIQKRSDTTVIQRKNLISVEIKGHELTYNVLGCSAPIKTRGTMSNVAGELADGPFVQISSSCIVGLAHISHIKHDSVIMSNGSEYWLSRRMRKEAMERITEYLGRTL